uniref:Coiled-coil-helix-coiled-coil-helix domain-containing protein 7 n=1 Tax=Sciurus vulgaris TaxID=55149 RepID=A0A8D2CS14_SCIVU
QSPGPKTNQWTKVTIKPKVDSDINSCLSESDASTRCMDENNYDRERCSSYSLKYKNYQRF